MRYFALLQTAPFPLFSLACCLYSCSKRKCVCARSDFCVYRRERAALREKSKENLILFNRHDWNLFLSFYQDQTYYWLLSNVVFCFSFYSPIIFPLDLYSLFQPSELEPYWLLGVLHCCLTICAHCGCYRHRHTVHPASNSNTHSNRQRTSSVSKRKKTKQKKNISTRVDFFRQLFFFPSSNGRRLRQNIFQNNSAFLIIKELIRYSNGSRTHVLKLVKKSQIQFKLLPFFAWKWERVGVVVYTVKLKTDHIVERPF